MSDVAQIVFIVDDDASFLTGITRLLRVRQYTVASFSSARAFLEHRPLQAAGCVIADLQMPGMDGMALQQEMVKSANPLPIIFLTGHGDIPKSVTAMRHGAEDFLQKTASKEMIFAAIERAMARDVEELQQRMRQRELLSRFSALTPRENEVLSHVLRGQLNKRIAADLGIDERSVKRHRTSLMAKLNVKSVVELTKLADELRFTNLGIPEKDLSR